MMLGVTVTRSFYLMKLSHIQRDILYLRIFRHSTDTFLSTPDITRLFIDDIYS